MRPFRRRLLLPGATRVAWIMAPTAIHTVTGRELPQARLSIRDAGRRLSIDIHELVVQQPEDFDRAFARILEARAQAIAVQANTLTWRERKRIGEFALRHRLPSAHGERDYVEAGGLVSYGVNWHATFPPTVAYVDRILRGARPADLPVELPSRYELAINLKTARALGLAVPQSVLLRADRVIE